MKEKRFQKDTSVLPFPCLLFHLEDYDLRQMLQTNLCELEWHVCGAHHDFLNFADFSKYSKLKIKHVKNN